MKKTEKRQYDCYLDSLFTKKKARLLVPSWCANCEDPEDKTYREEPFHYRFKSFESDPYYDFQYNSLKYDGFYELDHQEDDFDPDDLKKELIVVFNSAHEMRPYEDYIRLTITYEQCSEKEYEDINE